MTNATESGNKRQSAPYVGFPSYKNMISGFHDNVVPSRVDRSVLGKFSGIVGSQLLGALRFFNQIDSDGRPQAALEPLVATYGTDSWPKALGDQLRAAYKPIFELNLKTASPAEFTERFREFYPAEGDTLRKALTFFLNAAREAKIEVNSYILKNKKPRSGAAKKPRPPKPEVKEQVRHGEGGKLKNELNGHGESASKFKQDLLDKFPAFDPNWPDNIKAEWFKGFDQFMQMTREKK